MHLLDHASVFNLSPKQLEPYMEPENEKIKQALRDLYRSNYGLNYSTADPTPPKEAGKIKLVNQKKLHEQYSNQVNRLMINPEEGVREYQGKLYSHQTPFENLKFKVVNNKEYKTSNISPFPEEFRNPYESLPQMQTLDRNHERSSRN